MEWTKQFFHLRQLSPWRDKCDLLVLCIEHSNVVSAIYSWSDMQGTQRAPCAQSKGFLLSLSMCVCVHHPDAAGRSRATFPLYTFTGAYFYFTPAARALLFSTLTTNFFPTADINIHAHTAHSSPSPPSSSSSSACLRAAWPIQTPIVTMEQEEKYFSEFEWEEKRERETRITRMGKSPSLVVHIHTQRRSSSVPFCHWDVGNSSWDGVIKGRLNPRTDPFFVHT